MAYTYVTFTLAFNKAEATPEGYDYLTGEEAMKRVVDAGIGRFYIDGEGNATYESRLHREAP